MVRLEKDRSIGGRNSYPNDSRWQLSPKKQAYVHFTRDSFSGSQWAVKIYTDNNKEGRTHVSAGFFTKKDGKYLTKIDGETITSRKIPDMIYALYEAMLKNEKWKKSPEALKAIMDRSNLEYKLRELDEERKAVLKQIYAIDTEFSKRLGS
jgi:hypothetical protein